MKTVIAILLIVGALGQAAFWCLGALLLDGPARSAVLPFYGMALCGLAPLAAALWLLLI